MIPRLNYFDKNILQTEVDRLFRASFEFIALAPELLNDGDFVCLEYANTSIVVQNFRGVIKAFENICTHRFNRIQVEDRGNRSLTCRYHGWRFDADGCPLGAADRIEDMGPETQAALCLPKYRVDRCGQFFFVARGDEAASLKDYLGSFFQVLEKISEHIGREVHFGNIPHAANWKLLVENVIDSTHCSVVHRDSFVAFGFCRTPVEEVVTESRHSSWHVPRVPTEREGARQRALAHLSSRPYAHDSFYHIFIFPNLFIASTEGASFYVGQAMPVTPDKTVLRARYFEPAILLSDRHRVRQDVLNDGTTASSLQIVEEDKPILESIQQRMMISSRPGALLKNEPRVRYFFNQYLNVMTDTLRR